MKESNGRRVLRNLCAAAVVGIGAIALAQAAEEVYVNKPALQIRAGKGGAYDTVVTAKQGDKLTILAHEDNWLKVQFGDQQGYVLAASTSARHIKADNTRNMLAGGADAGGLQASEAAKGLTPEAEGYAKEKNLSPKLVKEMKARRKAITGAEWAAFAKEGNVGPERKK